MNSELRGPKRDSTHSVGNHSWVRPPSTASSVKVYLESKPHRVLLLFGLLGNCGLAHCKGQRPPFLFLFVATHGTGRLSSAGNFVCSSTQPVSSWACVRPEAKDRLAPCNVARWRSAASSRAPVRSAPDNVAPRRFASWRLAWVRFAWVKFEPLRSAATRLADSMVASLNCA